MKLFYSFIYLPLLSLLSFFFFWLPAVRERVAFEKKNLTDAFCQTPFKADLCFEFSSEGEYQQVASLIDDALKMGKKIELIFFSPSVEKTIMELAKKYPQDLRYLRYPLITFRSLSFSQWITAPHLILVRYDLFLDFLLWARLPQHKLSMVWMSFKKERTRHKKISWMKKSFLKSAKKVVYATQEDLRDGLALGVKGEVYDFRIEQIRRRVEKREQKLLVQCPFYTELRKRLESYPREKRLIFGNVWPSDLALLKDIPKDFIVVVLPHNLTPEILEAFRSGLPQPVEVTQEDKIFPESQFYLFNIKGILCELYPDFGKAYVGGGFEKSIHSLLEPLVAGSDHLASGPKHHRSTEFDLAQALGNMSVIKSPEDFLNWLKLTGEKSSSTETLRPFLNRYDGCSKEVISC